MVSFSRSLLSLQLHRGLQAGHVIHFLLQLVESEDFGGFLGILFDGIPEVHPVLPLCIMDELLLGIEDRGHRVRLGDQAVLLPEDLQLVVSP